MTILEIQKRLLALGYSLPKFGADGHAGDETAAALKAFQRKEGLVQTGRADEATLAKMFPASAPPVSSVIVPWRARLIAMAHRRLAHRVGGFVYGFWDIDTVIRGLHSTRRDDRRLRSRGVYRPYLSLIRPDLFLLHMIIGLWQPGPAYLH